MLTLLVALVVCGNEDLRVPAAALAPAIEGRPVIVHLVNRDHVVSITTGPSGPRYTAKTQDGTVVATGLTLQQLRDQHPDIYRKLHPAISADASARLDIATVD